MAFDLYCRTPFSKIGLRNPEIVKLASLLGRTPSSVGLKMHNLAHYDPELRKRNITAMAHTSKLDAEISEEFQNDWMGLSYQAQVIKARMMQQDLSDIVEIDSYGEIPEGTTRESILKTRVGQDFFRKVVLNSYGNKCCVTGLNDKKLLIASHIKPWRVSEERKERTNPSNGLCLNPFHDKAFDKGLITVSQDYKVVISKQIKEDEMDRDTREWFMSYEGQTILLPDKFYPGKSFLEYHSDVVFLG